MKTKAYELAAFFDAGFPPKAVIKLGYKRSTVYKHHARWKEAKRKVKEKLCRLI